MSATAVLTPAAASLLTACERPAALIAAEDFRIASPEDPVRLPLHRDPIPDGLSPESGATLQIYNWDEYMWTTVLDEFAAEYDCDYEIRTFDDVAEAAAKMNTGDIVADLFFPTYDFLGRLAGAELLQPLNHSYIPNLERNVWPSLQDPFYDLGSRYSVPYVVYTTGIGYRRDVVADQTFREVANPWSIFWDREYSGKTGVYDDYRDPLVLALLKNGATDVNTEDPTLLEAARGDLIELIDLVNVRTTVNGSYKGLPEGEFHLHQAWSGDMVGAWSYVPEYTEERYQTLGYWMPEDRLGPADNDLITIPANASHPVLAHHFLNYMLDFEVAMDNFSYVGYQPPQNKAIAGRLTTTEGRYSRLTEGAPAMLVPPWMEAAVVREKDFEIGYRILELSPWGDKLWRDAWQQFKAGA